MNRTDCTGPSIAGLNDALSTTCSVAPPVCSPCRFRLRNIGLAVLLIAFLGVVAAPGIAATASASPVLAATPPMGWNDWAHYQCNINAQVILANAKALVRTGLAARGYNTVTIDDCWMLKHRDAQGNLQADRQLFPDGIKPVAAAVHALGLKFGIYEDAGYATCGGFAGSGEPKGGGKDHFLQDARLFASWGVDYLKLDACNVYVPKGGTKAAAYRKAYAAENAALKAVGRPIIFSESAPAYFQGTPDWYDVLTWVRDYGQLWREGTDIATFDAKKPDTPRFHSVLWNYAYNLPLGRFQKPGNWNDADFIIGGDSGLTLAETRSQLALWSMMSAPLILSSNLDRLGPEALKILGNRQIIAVDQDALGRMATLVRRGRVMDLLLKPLSDGEYAVAALNRGTKSIHVNLRPVDFGFPADGSCRLDAVNLWNGTRQPAATLLEADIAGHDTAIWRIHPASSCGTPTRTGAIALTVPKAKGIETYSRCLAAPGRVETCTGAPAELWTVTASGALESEGRCLTPQAGHPILQPCAADKAQHWRSTLVGNLIDAEGNCLSASGADGQPQTLTMRKCGHNQPNQIWSLPN